MDRKTAAHALYPYFSHADAEATFQGKSNHGLLPQHFTKTHGNSSKQYLFVSEDMATTWDTEAKCPRVETQEGLAAGIADAYGDSMVFLTLRGRNVLNGEFSSPTRDSLKTIQALFRDMYGDVIGAGGEQLLVPTSFDQFRELALGLLVAGKVPPPHGTARRTQSIAELEQEDNPEASSSRIVRPRVARPLEADDDSSSGEEHASIQEQRRIDDVVIAIGSFRCPVSAAAVAAPSPTQKRSLLVHSAPSSCEAFSRMREEGGGLWFVPGAGLDGAAPAEAYRLPGRLRSKVEQAMPAAGRGRKGGGLAIESYSDQRYLDHILQDDLPNALGAAEPLAHTAERNFSRAEVHALLTSAARKSAVATAAGISDRLTENALIITKGSNIGSGTHDLLRRVMSFETAEEAKERSAGEPRRTPHRAFRDCGGPCSIGQAMSVACERNSRTLPLTLAAVGTCTAGLTYRVLELDLDSLQGGCNARLTTGKLVGPGEEGFDAYVYDSVLKHEFGSRGGWVSWLFSLTMSLTWAIFFAIKSIRLPKYNKSMAVIVEVDLRKVPGLIIDVSTPDAGSRNGLYNKWPQIPLGWANSAKEVLVEGVPVTAYTGRYFMIRPGTTSGNAALALVGGDHKWPDVGKKTFGCYSRWLPEGLEKTYYTAAKMKEFFKSMEVCPTRPEPTVVEGRRPTARAPERLRD
jgi:hypothetical protein